MNYIVYKTTNLLNGRFYVGVHNSESTRYLGSGDLLKSAIKKYGRKNFIRETLVECGNDSEEAYSIEALLVKTQKEDPRSYNIEPGGKGNSNLGKTVVDRGIGIHAATFEQRSAWSKTRIQNTPIDTLREISSNGGKRCAELGKAGFQTVTPEQRAINSQNANETKKLTGNYGGGPVTAGCRTYHDSDRKYVFRSSDTTNKALTDLEFVEFLNSNPQFGSGSRTNQTKLKGNI
jgi:hypothetical protein